MIQRSFNMRHSQRGVTFIGWVVLLVPVAIVVFAGIRLTPIYLNYMRVAKSLSLLATENKGETSTAEGLRNSLEKHFNIEGIEKPDVKDIDIRREGSHWVAIGDYEDVAPMFGNVSLLVEFHKQVDIL
jgi:hypothetical protein